MNEPTRVGLVGLGTIARTHLEVLAERSDVDLDFTVDPHTGPTTFRGGPRPHYRELAEALADRRPELVVIATPADSHADLARQVLAGSRARVLVEKPLAVDLAALDGLRAADGRGRVFTAHHFAFSPEVRWAAGQLADHPEWGPVTAVTSAFYDPYVAKGDQAFTSYLSSWIDSGINQLTVLAGLVEPTAVTALHESDGGAGSWATVAYRSQDRTGTARLRAGWHAGASSKSTVLTCGDTGVEVWLDHTSMVAFAFRGDELLAERRDDGRTPRKIAHYRPLYESLLSDRPDPILAFDAAARVTELHQSAHPRIIR